VFGSLADLRMDMMPVLCVLGGRPGGGEEEVLTLIVMNSPRASSSSAGADSSRVFVVGGAEDR
jgi:hypothetical protein